MFQERIEAVRRAMAAQSVDCILLGPSSTMTWLTGVSTVQDERLQLLVVPREGPVRFLMPEMYSSLLERSEGDREIFPWSDQDDPYQLLSRVCGRADRIAVDNQLWAVHFLAIQKALPAVNCVMADSVTRDARMRKDRRELDLLHQAGEAADEAFLDVLPFIHEGMTERELAFRLECLCREKGGEGMSFPPLAAFGPNAADPHHLPDDTPLVKNCFVLMDFGCRIGHYCSDTTRTVCFGKADEEMRRVYRVVQEANAKGREMARVGITGEELDAAVRRVIADAGYGEQFIHRTGHGLGLDDHEDPYIVQGNRRTLETGNVFSIEPGIYLPGRFGVRIEDIVAVTEAGSEVMNHSSRELIEL